MLKPIRMRSGVRTNVVTITPSVAESYLKMNIGNRPKKSMHVDFLAKEMREGRWMFNGDAIRIADDGRVLDGQHRLQAIVDSGTEQKTVLVTGLEADVFPTIDTGRPRSAGDALAISGHGNVNAIAAVCRLIVSSDYFSGEWDGQNAKGKMPHIKILEAAKNVEGIEASVNFAKSAQMELWRRSLGPSPCAFVLLWLHKIAPDFVDEFIEEVEGTASLVAKSPASLLHRKFATQFSLSKGNNYDLTRIKMAHVFRAWNAMRGGEKIKRITWTPSQKFPTPK